MEEQSPVPEPIREALDTVEERWRRAETETTMHELRDAIGDLERLITAHFEGRPLAEKHEAT